MQPSPDRDDSSYVRGVVARWAVRRASLVVLLLGALGTLAFTQGSIHIPVPLEDPLGLGDGVPVQLGPVGPRSDERPQVAGEAATIAHGEFPAGTDVIEMPAFGTADFPFGIPPSRLEILVRFDGSMTLHVPGAVNAGDYPAELVTTGARIATLRIEDSSGAQPVSLGPFGLAEGVAIRWRKSDSCSASSCRYRASGEVDDLQILISAAGVQLEAVLDVLGNDYSPNRLTGRLVVAFDQGLPDDVTVEVVLLAPSGTAFF